MANNKTNGNGVKNGKEKRDQDIKDYYFRKGKDLQTRFNLSRATVLLVFGDKGEGIIAVELRHHYEYSDYKANA